MPDVLGPFTFKYVEYNGDIPPLKINPYAFTKVRICYMHVYSSLFKVLTNIHDMIKFVIQNLHFQVSNMIFIDQPVGTGFSYTEGRNNEKVGDLSSVKQSVEFLKKV